MSFFSNAVRFIRKKEERASQNDEKIIGNTEYSEIDNSLELDFSTKNYVKESFSVLIIKPLSSCMHKILRSCSFLITGTLVGGFIALVGCLIALQFGSVENSVISVFLLNKIEQMLPDYDLSIKSAMLHWNSDIGTVEIDLNKVRFDDLFIPRVAIIPDYSESFKQQRFIAKEISIIKPKISIDVADNFQTITFNPNLAKGGTNRAYFEPISIIKNVKDSLIGSNSDAKIKLINADVSIIENGVHWNLQNLYCEHDLVDDLPSVLDFRTILPKQNYSSNINIVKNSEGSVYNVKISSLNPSIIYEAFVGRQTPIEKFMSLIKGYNLPVSGDIKIAVKPDYSLKEAQFNMFASNGSIGLPNRNTLSLNLGKRIDNGNISGKIYSNKMLIDHIKISYGNSGVQLSGISVPMSDFRFLDVANVNGTLSLNNVNTEEIRDILPYNLSKTMIPTFQNYLPGLRLDFLKFDLKGAIYFGDRVSEEKLIIGQGVFKIHNAQFPIDGRLVTNIDATGTIKTDGFDVKISNAVFDKTKINSGIFFISNRDDSWIGRIKAELPIEDIAPYAPHISEKFASFPLEKLNIGGMAKVDLKLLRVAGDNLSDKSMKFRMLEGNGYITSKDNTKQFHISWNEKGLSAIADITDGKEDTHLKIKEDFLNNKGHAYFKFNGESRFLTAFMPIFAKNLHGNFNMEVGNYWDARGEDSDISINLVNASMQLPVIGSVKVNNEIGTFRTHIHKYPDRIVMSKIALDTPKTQIKGQITTDNDWNLTEFVADKLVAENMSATVSILKKNSKKLIVSLVGDRFDAIKLIGAISQMNKDMKLVTYLNLKELIFNGMHKMTNVKGNLEILGHKVIEGACIGVIGESTVVLSTSDMKDGNNYLLSISASNAGNFFQALGFGTSIQGGSLNLVMKSSKLTDSSMSGGFELNDFIVSNNPQLTRLISLSSPNYINGTNLVAGFNTCAGSIFITNKMIKIENCKVVGPTIAVSISGDYDRVNDNLNFNGLLLPTTTGINNRSNGLLSANFSISGSYWNPSLSVKTPKIVPSDTLLDVFGNLVPILNVDYTDNKHNDYDITPPVSNITTIKDPYSQNVFDRINPEEPMAKKQAIKKKIRPIKSLDKKFGVTIKRGLKSSRV